MFKHKKILYINNTKYPAKVKANHDCGINASNVQSQLANHQLELL